MYSIGGVDGTVVRTCAFHLCDLGSVPGAVIRLKFYLGCMLVECFQFQSTV